MSALERLAREMAEKERRTAAAEAAFATLLPEEQREVVWRWVNRLTGETLTTPAVSPSPRPPRRRTRYLSLGLLRHRRRVREFLRRRPTTRATDISARFPVKREVRARPARGVLLVVALHAQRLKCVDPADLVVSVTEEMVRKAVIRAQLARGVVTVPAPVIVTRR